MIEILNKGWEKGKSVYNSFNSTFHIHITDNKYTYQVKRLAQIQRGTIVYYLYELMLNIHYFNKYFEWIFSTIRYKIFSIVF